MSEMYIVCIVRVYMNDPLVCCIVLCMTLCRRCVSKSCISSLDKFELIVIVLGLLVCMTLLMS